MSNSNNIYLQSAKLSKSLTEITELSDEAMENITGGKKVKIKIKIVVKDNSRLEEQPSDIIGLGL